MDSEGSTCLREYPMSYNWQTDYSGTLSQTSKKQSERCDLYSGWSMAVKYIRIQEERKAAFQNCLKT